jgi:hypothetical protein
LDLGNRPWERQLRPILFRFSAQASPLARGEMKMHTSGCPRRRNSKRPDLAPVDAQTSLVSWTVADNQIVGSHRHERARPVHHFCDPLADRS